MTEPPGPTHPTVAHAWFFQQAGGCIEIGQQDGSRDGVDIIHICTADVHQFMIDLDKFRISIDWGKVDNNP